MDDSPLQLNHCIHWQFCSKCPSHLRPQRWLPHGLGQRYFYVTWQSTPNAYLFHMAAKALEAACQVAIADPIQDDGGQNVYTQIIYRTSGPPTVTGPCFSDTNAWEHCDVDDQDQYWRNEPCRTWVLLLPLAQHRGSISPHRDLHSDKVYPLKYPFAEESTHAETKGKTGEVNY